MKFHSLTGRRLAAGVCAGLVTGRRLAAGVCAGLVTGRRLAAGVCAGLMMAPASSQDAELSVSEIMTALITPMTNSIWGAYDIQDEAQWQALENAALTVVAAGSLLKTAGPDASNSEWQEFNQQMIAAARAAIAAIENRDEEALSGAGNDLLYPPCESCHQRFMSQ